MAESKRRQAHRAGEQGRELPQTLRDAAEDDPQIIDAYDAGHAGRSWEQFNNREPVEEPAPQSEPVPTAPEPEPTPATPPPAPARRSGGVLAGAGADTGAGLFLGAILYALLLSLINYGPSGPADWLKAKFLNQPTQPPGKGGATTGSAAPAPAGSAKASVS